MFPNELLKKFLNALVTSIDGLISFRQIDVFNDKIEKGEALFVSEVYTVANGADIYIHHVSGSTKYLHSMVEASSVGTWAFVSYAGTTYVDPGDLLTQVNKKSDSAYTPEVKFYENLVGDIDVLGTERLSFTFGSGTNPAKASTAAATEKSFTIFAPDDDILVKLTNNSGSEQLLTVLFTYYET